MIVRFEEISRDPSSYVDPQGFVFHFDNQIFRFIHREAAPFYQGLLADGTLSKWEQEFGVVATAPSNLAIEEEPEGTVVRHERISPISYCVEWCPSMLRDAGMLTLDLAIELASHGLMLQDAYPWNVLFSGSKPIFVDLTSIVPGDEKVIWPAHDQFEAFFTRPLALSDEGKGKAARALLFDNIEGVGLEDFYRLISPYYRFRNPGLVFTRWLGRRLQRSSQMKERVRNLAEKAATNISPSLRIRFLKRLSRSLGGTKSHSRGDPWTQYYHEIEPGIDKKTKLDVVSRILERLKPETVLDLGCNTGVFSLVATKSGAHVISIDSSESCIEQLYAAAQGKLLPITPLISDVLCPTPAFGFMSKQHPKLLQRARSEVVLCLGLMHHLHITGRQSFERIAELVSSVTEKYLLFEFVAQNDANNLHLPQRRKIDYSLDTVLPIFKSYFKNIEIHPSDRTTRKILICAK